MKLEFIEIRDYWWNWRYDFNIVYEDNEEKMLPVFEREFKLNCRNQLL